MALFKCVVRNNLIVNLCRGFKTPPTKKTLEWRESQTFSNSGKYKTRSFDVEADVKTLLTHDKSDEVNVIEDNKVDVLSGVPDEHIKSRYVRIFMPPKNAMQSGTFGTRNWKIEFDQRERWENNLMGWTSTGDPMSNMAIEFESAEAASNYCESMGLSYQIEKPNKHLIKPKSYGSNFSWNNRTRVLTK